MPYYDGSIDKINQYNETLDAIQSVIDTMDPSPVMVVRDMNAPYPSRIGLPVDGTNNAHFIITVCYYMTF